MIEPVPSYIPVNGCYMATIKVGSDETILEDGGRRLLFDTSTSALRAARSEIEARKEKPIKLVHTTEEDAIIAQWKAKRLQERNELRSAATLFGVEVVRKKRRAVKR